MNQYYKHFKKMYKSAFHKIPNGIKTLDFSKCTTLHDYSALCPALGGMYIIPKGCLMLIKKKRERRIN